MAKEFDIYLRGKAKPFDICLNGKEKQFDIYLNNRLTQCDIFVYSIPYRDGLKIVNSLVLDSRLDGITLRKVASIDNIGAIEIDQSVKGTTKHSFDKYDGRLNVSADIENMYKNLTTSVDSSMVMNVDPIGLFYRDYMGGNSDLLITASVSNTELHFSIGSGVSDIVLGVDIDKGELVSKYEKVQPAIGLLVSLREVIRQFSTPSEAAIQFSADVKEIIKKYRLLSDLDKTTLLSIDSMTLDDLDYIVL